MTGPGRTLDLQVGPVAHGGHCVARWEGRVVFVRHALPTERVRAVLTEAAPDARFWRADAVQVLAPAADRVPSRCPAAGPGGCGGCDWQHASLPAQRRLKGQVVAEQLRRLAGVDLDPDDLAAQPVPGDDDGLGWRTRVRFAVDDAGRAGLRAHRSHDVVPLGDCPLAHPGLGVADLLARTWPAGAQVVVSGGSGEAAPATVEVVEDGRARRESGPARRTEHAAGRSWRVSGAGFWQVHPGAADTLVSAVRTVLAPRPGERLLDLYSGVGLFAGSLVDDLGPDGEATAVEAHPGASRDARRNLHDLPRVRIVEQRVERYLRTTDEPTDLVVLDPPRTGAGREVCTRVAQRTPRAIAYVACDPAALARDVAVLAALGYGLTSLRVLDLFPMTHHVECVAGLEPLAASTPDVVG
jgi:tRNA/tmRNA/rRNA uracil-C5-methylase (TrmA/RlmC/RlmD family)